MVSPAESTSGRRSAYQRGLALPPPSPGAAPGFPVPDAAHWDKARQAVGRVKSPARRAALARMLRRTAPRFGKTQELKNSWAASNTWYGSGMDLAGGEQMQCPRCGYKSDDADFRQTRSGTANTNDPGGQSLLRTPAAPNLQAKTGFSPGSAGVNVRGGGTAPGLANTGQRAISLSRRMPVHTASDIIVARADDGTAIIRHRLGGATIGSLRRGPDGLFVSRLDGSGADLPARTHQRTALADLIGGWNKVSGPDRPAMPLQAPPQQTDLMRQYGVPAIRALASPTAGYSDGPRAAGRDDDGDSDGGLTPKGQGIYRKLKAKGWPDDRARKFAMRAQNMGGKAA